MGAGRSRRTGLILIVLIVLILVVGVAAIFFLQGFLGGGTPDDVANVEATVVIPTPTPPPTVNIIVAARDIPRGARLSVQDVTILRWPVLAEAPPPIDALVVADGDGAGLEQVDGRIARVDIITGQPVLDFMITPGDEPTSLGDTGSDASLLIPSGNVMMTIPISRLSAVGYALREGDHVDLLMSFDFVDVDEDFQTELPNNAIAIVRTDESFEVGVQYVVGRQESTGPFGSTLLVIPQEGSQQIPRRTTQLVVDNAVVVRMGEWSLSDINNPIIVTPLPPPTAVPEGEEAVEEQPPTPTPVPPKPDIISLALSRQDALVLKYALEIGADIDMVLRSALDDDLNDIVTDPVTLEYIIQFYDVPVPNRLPSQISPEMLGLGFLNSFFDESSEELGPPVDDGSNS